MQNNLKDQHPAIVEPKFTPHDPEINPSLIKIKVTEAEEYRIVRFTKSKITFGALLFLIACVSILFLARLENKTISKSQIPSQNNILKDNDGIRGNDIFEEFEGRRLDVTSPPVYKSIDEAREDLTLVTCFFDIGRGTWGKQGRSNDEYFKNAERIMALKNKMVIFIQPDLVKKVRDMREQNNLMHRTTIVEMSFHELQFAKLTDKIQEIMNSTDYKARLGTFASQFVEYWNAPYDIVQYAKSELVEKAIRNGYQPSTYYAWIDFGVFSYAYSTTEYWIPMRNDGLFKQSVDQVRILAMPDYPSLKSKQIVDIVAVHRDWMLGTIWGGHKQAVLKFCPQIRKAVQETIDARMVGDDQDVMSWIYAKHSEMINPVRVPEWRNMFYSF